MKRFVVLAWCLWPVLAFAQDSYTNADLSKFHVPGAYTNEDLRRLSPLAVQKVPAALLPPFIAPRGAGAGYQAIYDSLARTRDNLAAELAYEKNLVDYSESAFAGDTRDFTPRLGYRAQATLLIQELTKRVWLIEKQMDDAADEARRSGAPVERR